ncbi:M28 family peptidase [Aurantiacibacter gangjinensis]|uniref:Peptidase M28 n=1 Tax=Aurantiacibacter gangjinensis TaxID=502682 RepID=A0A0G9MQD2_9SPHN|nr:M28 family peptidase [Aurantiacibacter gangjinensis]APE28765.1 Leucine aminopeptidase-related protein [Aurantiacibacter gangjinensis]KLE32920.1 peptidase M28 [Aurantiacibacter gangjinensis]
MRNILIAVAAATVAFPAAAHDHHGDPGLEVSEERLRADMDTIVGFGTRHTLSSQTDPERGIGAAVNWALAEFGRIGDACDDCLEVLPVGRIVEADGRRIPQDTLVRNAVAIQRGTERPDEVIIVQAHYDSRVTDPLNGTDDAPGANDDGSGSVMVLEAARILSQRDYPSTIIYALVTGEEQGLYGAGILADWVGEQGMTVKAVLNNDMIGNSCGSDGFCDAEHVRVFSEGLRADSTEELRARQRRFGGENDSPGRNLSRWLNDVAEDYPNGMQVRQIWRTDRMGRGGDQIPFLDRGYPAVRVTVAVEDYEHQHQDLRVEDGITYGDTVDELDWTYLTRASQLNLRALDRLARAPMPPSLDANGIVRTDTVLTWNGVEGASTYVVMARRTNEPEWTQDVAIVNYETSSGTRPITPMTEREHSFVSPLRGDDWIFGIQACGSTPNSCSPFSSAVPGGAFYPLDVDNAD